MMIENGLPQVDKHKVVVLTITYNHSKYIEDTLRGFAMQQTDFPFLCCVFDDASTDGEQEVLKKWIENNCNPNEIEVYDHPLTTILKSPDKINPNCIYVAHLQKVNTWGKPEKRRLINYWSQFGEYIALCEGDDYWIDPLKLQKQVDFMEGHPECSLCFHNTQILNETASFFYTIPIDNREYSADELFREWIVPTASILYTREASLSIVLDSRIINGDINIVLACATVGKVYGMRDCMSVYRVQSNGVTISRAKTDNLNLQYSYIDHYKCLHENYRIVSDEYFDIKLADTYINIALIYIRRGDFIKVLLNICLAFRYRPTRLMHRLLRKLK